MVGVRILTASDIVQLDTAKQEQYGALGMSEDGRMFRYVGYAGTATVNAGFLMVSAAKTANSNNLAITAVGTGGQVTANLAAGSRQIVVTNGSTSVTQDQFLDGFLELIWSGGAMTYRINGNTAAGSAATFTVSLADPLRNAAALVAGTDTVNLTASPYAAATASLTLSNAIGATPVQVPNTASVTNYGWLQVKGHALLSATSGTKGQPAVQDLAGTAGFVANTGAGAAETSPQVGIFKETAANSCAPVELNLP